MEWNDSNVTGKEYFWKKDGKKEQRKHWKRKKIYKWNLLDALKKIEYISKIPRGDMDIYFSYALS